MKRRGFSIAIAVLLSAADTFAQEIITGYEGGPSNGYGFVTPVFSFPQSGTPSALVIRPGASFLYYNFQDAGGFTNVTSPGVSFGIGYRVRTPRVTLTVGPGFEVRSFPNIARTVSTICFGYSLSR